jgi:hypothetical protein
MASEIRVKEGMIVGISLEDSRLSIGLLSRVENESRKRPYGIFVYFFGPFLSLPDSIPHEDYFLSLKPIARLKTSAFDIYNGTWRILGTIKPWSRNKWVFPNFYEVNPLSGKSYFLRLDENDLVTPIEWREIQNLDNLDENNLYGSEAAMKSVSKLSSNIESIEIR